MSAKLDQLIEKYKKSSKLNQAESIEYVDELSRIINNNDYTEELDRALCDGHTDLSMQAFSTYINDVDDQKYMPLLNRFLHSPKMENNNSGGATIRLCNLLKYIRGSKNRKSEVEQKVFLYMVKYSYKAENAINGTSLKTIRKTILPMFNDGIAIMKLDFIDRPFKWNMVKKLFIEAVLGDEPFNQATCGLVYKWLESSGQPMKPYDENYMGKQITKITEKNKAKDINRNIGEKSDQETQDSHKINDNSSSTEEINKTSDDNKVAQGEIKQDGQEFSQKEDDPVAALVKLLGSQTEAIRILSEKMERVEKQIVSDSELIKRLQTELGTANQRYKTLYEEKKNLDDENEALAQQLEATDGLLQQLQDEYDSKNQFSDSVIKELKKDQEAFLNKLASKLKVDYTDFMDARGEKMTIDLGENMRAQLEEVFGILEKSGIRLKG